MTAIPAEVSRRVPAWTRSAVAGAIALLLAVAVVGTLVARAAAPAPSTVPGPVSPTVAFVVALRTFEQNGVALADQAVAQTTSPGLRRAAAMLAAHGDQVAASLWTLLDRWSVPGDDRLPAPTTGLNTVGHPAAPSPTDPTAGLHHTCTVLTNDELAVLSTLNGAVFDQRFASAWRTHAVSALEALKAARWGKTAGAPDLSALGLRAVVVEAERNLQTDLGTLIA